MLGCTYSHKPLALPLGELSPQATERVWPSQYTLSVLASLGHLSQGERQGRPPRLALPLGELSPQVTERVLQSRSARTLSVFAALSHLSQRERQEGIRGRQFLTHICQSSRERSKKTEAVFLVGSRRSGGKSKSLRARFLFATFSFGEAKEKVGRQLQICRRLSALCQPPTCMKIRAHSFLPGTMPQYCAYFTYRPSGVSIMPANKTA